VFRRVAIADFAAQARDGKSRRDAAARFRVMNLTFTASTAVALESKRLAEWWT
jgi:hypothetical protein